MFRCLRALLYYALSPITPFSLSYKTLFRASVNAYEVEAGIGVIAGNTVWSMPKRLECEVLQTARYINTLTFTFMLFFCFFFSKQRETEFDAK